jgi:hypothetical protein
MCQKAYTSAASRPAAQPVAQAAGRAHEHEPQQVSRLLDPKDGNVTIATLQRAARIVGRTLRLELV